MSLESNLTHHIRSHRLFDHDDKLLLAVSGGMDSMVMLHLLHDMGYSLHVAHCNFQLRGAESEEDANFVEESCRVLSIPCYVTRFDTQIFADKHMYSIQMAARDLRYTWFNSLREKHGFTAICTAHHADDQTETVLLNLVRGKGLSALEGIPVRNESVVRPLLPFTRAEIKVYAEQKNIRWRNDSSNDTTDYQRNYIRHEILPRLETLNPALNDAVRRLSTMTAEYTRLAEEQITRLLGGISESADDVYTLHTGGIASHPSLNTILHQYLQGFDFHPTTVAKLAAAIRQGESGKTFFGAGFRAITAADRLIIDRAEPERIYAEGTLGAGADEVTVQQHRLRTVHLPILDVPANLGKDPHTVYVDADLLSYPLVVRPWKAGDQFQPLGMDHRQKISDFLINNKVSLHEKEQCYVLQSGDDIVWVIGYRIDQRYRLTEKTRNALRITYHTS